MSRIRPILVLSVCLLTAVASFAQKPPVAGPPSTSPQVIVDANGTTVGTVIDLVNGLNKANVKYTLPNGDFVVLVAGSVSLGGTASPQATGLDPINAKVFFTTNNCTGDAYVVYNNTITTTTQLAKFQSITLFGTLPTQLPPPVPNSSCPIPVPGDEWLYTAPTSNFLCPVITDPVHTVTFNSYYGYPYPPYATTGGGSQCAVPLAGPITFGGPNPYPYSGQAFVVYSPTENLSLNYKAPFSVK